MKKAGFSLIEVMVAVGLAALFLPAIGITLSSALSSSVQGDNFSKAYRLAQEGMEAVFYLKSQNDLSWDWTNTPDNTIPGQYYQPAQTGGVWQLGSTTTTPVITPSPFTRKIEITQVCRDASSVLSDCSNPGASVDQYSRKIVTYVSWSEKGQTQEVKLDAYVTFH